MSISGTNPNYNPALATMKNIISMPAKTSTICHQDASALTLVR